jgi:predicted P-loop ATPase
MAKVSSAKSATSVTKIPTAVLAIENFLSSKYQFRYNPISDRTEFKTIKGKNYEFLTERDMNSLFRDLNHAGIKCQISTLKSIINSDFIEESDPFLEYFNTLPKYTKKSPDYIGQLMDTVRVQNLQFWKKAFPKWLVSTVACSISKNEVNQHVLVFIGNQGIGKSTWLNKLVPNSLEGYLYSGIVNPNNKDTLVNLAENFIINLDELENLNKIELGSLKALITQSAIRLRKAYGVYNENFVRRASFVGSVNEVEFLTDPTGNRRYLVINCEDIDYMHEVDMDLVYSQAYHLYKEQKNSPGKFKYHFDKIDNELIEDNNKAFVRVSIEEELVTKYFRTPSDEDDDSSIIYMTATDIMNFVLQKEKMKAGDPSFLRRLGNVLKKHGFTQKSMNNQKPYKLVDALKKVKINPIDSDMEYSVDDFED